VTGWKVATDFDAYGLDREIQKAGWTLFCLAGEMKATVFGIDDQSMLRRAIGRILGRAESDRFNSLEITRVSSVGSERFPLVRYVTVSAQWRHIQQSLFLSRAGELPMLHTREDDIHAEDAKCAKDETSHLEEATKPHSKKDFDYDLQEVL